MGISGTPAPTGLFNMIGVSEQFTSKVPPDNGYELRVKANSGTVKSSVVKGFEIPVRAIFDEEECGVAAQYLLSQ
ncbi:MAG: hypothetical protein HGB17_01975 [Syntrophobacteraceae bacterium]|nr:hypothetical protein [Syntrophobacteraceae bacterium]